MIRLAIVRAGRAGRRISRLRRRPGTVPAAGRSNRMTICWRPELQSAASEGPREPNDPPARDRPEPPARDRPEPPVRDPPPNPPEPDQPFGDPTPLPGNDPPDPPMRA